jgi:hypothetical protein
VTFGETFEEVAKPSDPTASDLPGPSLADMLEPDIEELAEEALPTDSMTAQDERPRGEADPAPPSAAVPSRWRLRRRERTDGDGVY